MNKLCTLLPAAGAAAAGKQRAHLDVASHLIVSISDETGGEDGAEDKEILPATVVDSAKVATWNVNRQSNG